MAGRGWCIRWERSEKKEQQGKKTVMYGGIRAKDLEKTGDYTEKAR